MSRRAAPSRAYVAEPPAAYRMAPPLVADCSMLAAVLFQEPERDEAQARVAGFQLNAPTLIDYEVASVALKKALRGGGALAADALDRFAALAIRTHPVEPKAVVALAGRYGLSAYDAAYLWLAADLRAPLATFDRRLGEAALVHLRALE